ncbi:M48 family metallopeptidase [Sphingomonas suaedae]|uniref:M48 family metallopeptidase n=1 Tax=Sphingomonas suaedae TaxID=2599297 RepID=UPI0030D04CD4
MGLGWDSGFPRTPLLDDGQIIAGGPREGYERRIERWLRRTALDTLSAETADYAALSGVSVSKVAVGDPKGRWGSCASSGVIRYSWRLILAPPEVRRATVAHEVAHRTHMNHGPGIPRAGPHPLWPRPCARAGVAARQCDAASLVRPDVLRLA